MNLIPQHYVPKSLSEKDKRKQLKNLKQARQGYKKGKYVSRAPLTSFVSKPSKHVENAKKMYKVDNLVPSPELAKKTKCSEQALEEIVNKGRGAYYSSGSRPNQTAESWGLARLGSALTGGKSSVIDYHILEEGCAKNSKPLALARKTCKKDNKTCGSFSKAKRTKKNVKKGKAKTYKKK